MLEKSHENVISHIEMNSKADKLGIEIGDKLLKINDQIIEDIIEYMFVIADDYLTIEIEKKDGQIKKYQLHKEFDEDLGIVFENPIIDKAKSCKNKCIFCFIDQLPPNMRKTLYFKDDDSRLSFLQGNFITLTNMSDKDIEKIIKYRISPINISIHTTNPELRVKMLNNKTAGNIYSRLEQLANAGIKMNGQIVLCPGVNDETELDRSISDLSKLYPTMESIAVVPVGLTNFRESLFLMQGFKEISAKKTIDQVKKWQEILIEEIDTRFVYLSDEFYILAKESMPVYETYEGFPQLENGVGLMVKFEHEFHDYLAKVDLGQLREKEISVVTGVSAYEFMKKLCREIEDRSNHIKIHVHCIKNFFFGELITVSGLITGQDILKQLTDKSLGDKLIIPESMLKAEEEVFLDDITVDDLEKGLQTKVIVSKVEGRDFIDKLIEE